MHALWKVFLVILCVGVGYTSAQTEAYVDCVNGSDGNLGTSGSPYKSIDKAINSIVNPSCTALGFVENVSQRAGMFAGWMTERSLRVIDFGNVRIRFYLSQTLLGAEVWTGSTWDHFAAASPPVVGGTTLYFQSFDVYPVAAGQQTFYAFCVAMQNTLGAKPCYGGRMNTPSAANAPVQFLTYYPINGPAGYSTNIFSAVSLIQGTVAFIYTNDASNYYISVASYSEPEWVSKSVPTSTISSTSYMSITALNDRFIILGTNYLVGWLTDGSGGVQMTTYSYSLSCSSPGTVSAGSLTSERFAVGCSTFLAVYQSTSATALYTVNRPVSMSTFGGIVALSPDGRLVATPTSASGSSEVSVSIFDASTQRLAYTSPAYWSTPQMGIAFPSGAVYAYQYGTNPTMYAFTNGGGEGLVGVTTVYLVAPSTATTANCNVGTSSSVTITCPYTVFDLTGGVSGSSVVVKAPSVWAVSQTTWQNSRYANGVRATWSSGSGVLSPSLLVGNSTAITFTVTGWSITGAMVFKDTNAANGSTITSAAIDTLVVYASSALAYPSTLGLTNVVLGGTNVTASTIDAGVSSLSVSLIGDPTQAAAPSANAPEFLLLADNTLTIKGGNSTVAIDSTSNDPVSSTASVQMNGALQLDTVKTARLQGKRLEFSQQLWMNRVTTTYLDATDIVFTPGYVVANTLTPVWHLSNDTLKGLTATSTGSKVTFNYGTPTTDGDISQVKLTALRISDTNYVTPTLVTLPLTRFEIFSHRQTAPYAQPLPTTDWTYLVYLDASSTGNLNLQLATSTSSVYLPHWGYQQRIEEMMYHAPRSPVGTTTQGLVIYDALPGGAATLHISPAVQSAQGSVATTQTRMFELASSQLAAPYASRDIYIRDTVNSVTYGCTNATTGRPFYENAVPDCALSSCLPPDVVPQGCRVPAALPLIYNKAYSTGMTNTTLFTLAMALGETTGAGVHGTCPTLSAPNFQMGQVCQFQQGAGEAWIITFGDAAPTPSEVSALFGSDTPPTPAQIQTVLGNCSLVWSPVGSNYPQTVPEYWTPTSPASGLPWTNSDLPSFAPTVWTDTLQYTTNVTSTIYAYAAANNDPTWTPDVTPNNDASPFGVFAGFANKTIELLQTCLLDGKPVFQLQNTPTGTRLSSNMYVQNVRVVDPLTPANFTADDIATTQTSLTVTVDAKTPRLVAWWQEGLATTESDVFAQTMVASDQLTLLATFLEGDNTTQWTVGFTDATTGAALPGERYTPQLVDSSTPPATPLTMTNFSSTPLCYNGTDVPADVVVFLESINATYTGVCFFNTTLRMQAPNAYVGDQNHFSGVATSYGVTVWSSPPWAMSPTQLDLAQQVTPSTLNLTYAFNRYSSAVRPVALVANNTQVQIISPKYQDYMTVQQNATLVYPIYTFDDASDFYLSGALAFTDRSQPAASTFEYTPFVGGAQACTTDVASLPAELREYALQWEANGLCVFTTSMSWTVINVYVDGEWLFDGIVSFQQMALKTTGTLQVDTAGVVVPTQALSSLLLQDNVVFAGQGQRYSMPYFTTPQVVSANGVADVVIQLNVSLAYAYYAFDNTTSLGLLNAIEFNNSTSHPSLDFTWQTFPTGAQACSPAVPVYFYDFYAQHPNATGLCIFNTTVQWMGLNQYINGMNYLRGNLTLQQLVLASSPEWPADGGSVTIIDPASPQDNLIDTLDAAFAGTGIRGYVTSQTTPVVISPRASLYMSVGQRWSYVFPAYSFDDTSLFTLTGVGSFANDGTDPPLRNFAAVPFTSGAGACSPDNIALYPLWQEASSVCIFEMNMQWSAFNSFVGKNNTFRGNTQITGIQLETPTQTLVADVPDATQALDVTFPGSGIPAYDNPISVDASVPTISPDTNPQTTDMEISAVYAVTLSWPLTTTTDLTAQRWFVRGVPTYSPPSSDITMSTMPWTSALAANQPCAATVPLAFQNQTDSEGRPFIGACSMRTYIVLSQTIPANVATQLDTVSWQGAIMLNTLYIEQASNIANDPPLAVITTLVTTTTNPYQVVVNVSVPLANGVMPLTTPITSDPLFVNSTQSVVHQFSLAQWVVNAAPPPPSPQQTLSAATTSQTRGESKKQTKSSPRSKPSARNFVTPLASTPAASNAANVVGVVVCARLPGAPLPANLTYFATSGDANGGCFDTRAAYNLTVIYDPQGMLVADYGGVSPGWNVVVVPPTSWAGDFLISYSSRSLNASSPSATTTVYEEQFITVITLVQNSIPPTTNAVATLANAVTTTTTDVTTRDVTPPADAAGSSVIAPVYVTTASPYFVIVPPANNSGNGTNPNDGGGGGGGLPTWAIAVIVVVAVAAVGVVTVIVLIFTICRYHHKGIIVNRKQVQRAVQQIHHTRGYALPPSPVSASAEQANDTTVVTASSSTRSPSYELSIFRYARLDATKTQHHH